MADDYAQEFKDMVLDWMELPTKERVYAAVAAHDAEVRERVAKEIEAAIDDDDRHNDVWKAGMKNAAILARGKE